MKFYTITVNGNTYEVTVEENTSGVATSVAAPTPIVKTSPVTMDKKPATPTPAPSANSAGNIKVSSPMPGKIMSIKGSVGQAIKKGQVILVLEAMKMENEIVSPQDGTIASIDVSVGQSVEAGTLFATLK